MRRMYRVRKADNKIRATVKYKLEHDWSKSNLESDSAEERARESERSCMTL